MGMFFHEDKDDYAYDNDDTWNRSPISKFGDEDEDENERIRSDSERKM